MNESEGSEDYRIELDIYNGPLDLLLFLVYKNEVDIFNIPVADILQQYLAYVEVIKDLELENAGDFMVMAGRLINIKSKMLMPRPEAEPDEEEVIDPRAELVKELLEYKEYKERAYALEHHMSEREKMFERIPPPEQAGEEPVKEPEPELFDDDVTVWDLLSAFHKATKDFMPEVPRTIVYDDTPLSVYVDRLLERLEKAPQGRLAFESLFERAQERMVFLGMFLAILEAAKRGALRAYQSEGRDEIFLEFVPEGEREKRLQPETPEQHEEPAGPAPAEENPATEHNPEGQEAGEQGGTEDNGLSGESAE
jgi:segregation and condensation protein A